MVNVNVEVLENNCSPKTESEDKLFIYILIGVLVFLISILTVFVFWLIQRRNVCQHEVDDEPNELSVINQEITGSETRET